MTKLRPGEYTLDLHEGSFSISDLSFSGQFGENREERVYSIRAGDSSCTILETRYLFVLKITTSSLHLVETPSGADRASGCRQTGNEICIKDRSTWEFGSRVMILISLPRKIIHPYASNACLTRISQSPGSFRLRAGIPSGTATPCLGWI